MSGIAPHTTKPQPCLGPRCSGCPAFVATGSLRSIGLLVLPAARPLPPPPVLLPLSPVDPVLPFVILLLPAIRCCPSGRGPAPSAVCSSLSCFTPDRICLGLPVSVLVQPSSGLFLPSLPRVDKFIPEASTVLPLTGLYHFLLCLTACFVLLLSHLISIVSSCCTCRRLVSAVSSC